jgi:hypothetical protein
MKSPALSCFTPSFIFSAAAILSTLALGMPARAQENNNPEGLKEVKAVRVDTAPVLDGNLDDAVWQQAEVIDDFHQIRPGGRALYRGAHV